MHPPTLHFVVPGDIDARTGGYGYDREIIAGLRQRGWVVHVVVLPGDYPTPSDDQRAAAAHALAAVPDHACVLIDGLALGALPEAASREANRLRIIALVHHPLGLETGLDPETSARLLTSERAALQSVAGVIVTSPATVAAVVDLGVEPGRIAVVEPGTARQPIARGSGTGAVSLLIVASLVPRKGHDTLFTALERLVDLDWHLTCVGSLDRDPLAATLAARCATAPLRGRVTLLGELSGAALDAAYEAADLFVLPTHYEGYGMVVAEALSRGIPVVSTATGAIPDLVGDDAGTLVPPGDAEALSAVLEHLMNDRASMRQLREGALRVRALLPTWDTTMTAMEEALARFCAQ